MRTQGTHRTSSSVLSGFLAILASAASASAQNPPSAAFQHDRKLTTNEGHVALAWTADCDLLEYELQSAESPEFENPSREYLGANETFFLSGIPNGQYYFRIRARRSGGEDWGPWSDAVVLDCEHHPQSLAWTLFAAGGLLFVVTALFVVVNARSLERFERIDG